MPRCQAPPFPLEGATHQEHIEHFNIFMCAAQVHTLTPDCRSLWRSQVDKTVLLAIYTAVMRVALPCCKEERTRSVKRW